MPRTWVISCHAAISMQDAQVGKSNTTIKAVQLIPVPNGVTLIHFDSEAKVLVGGWEAYNALMKNPPAIGTVQKIKGYKKFTGPSIPNYFMTGEKDWIDSNGLSASGIFIAGDTYHRDPMTLYLLPGQQYTLKEFFEDPEVKTGDTVYWLACRAWMKDGRLVSFPAPLPAPPGPPPSRGAVGGIGNMLSALPPGSISSIPRGK
jgi:hypothetical protein